MTMSDCQKPQTKNNEPIKGGTGTALFLLAELIVHVPYFIILKYAEHKAIDKGRPMMWLSLRESGCPYAIPEAEDNHMITISVFCISAEWNK